MKCLLCINLIVIALCFVLPRIVQAIMFFSSWKTDRRELKWFRVALEKYNNKKTRLEAFFMFYLKFKEFKEFKEFMEFMDSNIDSFQKFFTGDKSSSEVKKKGGIK